MYIENKREYYEDIIQEMICKMLPSMDRSLIRPSYQAKGGFAGKNEINEMYDDGISGFTFIDNVIYFRVKFTSDLTSEILDDGTIYAQNVFDVMFNVYGENSVENSIIIRSKLCSENIKQFLNPKGIYYMRITNEDEEAREVINMQVWERHDFSVRYNVREEIDTKKNILSEGANIIYVKA